MTTQLKPCPICKKPRSPEHTPFCSTRCKDRDLMQWFGEGYAAPSRPASPDEITRSDWDAQE